MNAPDFLPAYATAIYKTAQVTFTLTPNVNDTILFEGKPFAIITAHNPRSQALTTKENQQRHQKLKNVLQKMQLDIAPSKGQAPNGGWQEEGFLILGISLTEALAIGRQFEQHAILYGQKNRVALAWCEEARLEWFYPKIA